MKKTFFSLVVTALAAFHLNAGEINVFAAANVTYAFDELKAEFAKTNPDTKVTVNLGASGALSTQVKNGAPADVFMAANMKFVQDLYDAKFAVSSFLETLRYSCAFAMSFSAASGLNLTSKK